jgi:hypothetical protein
MLLCGREDGTVTMSPNTRGAMGQPKLRFTSLSIGANGATTLKATVQPLTHYVLQTSPNLKDWSFLANAISTSNGLTITGLSISNAPVGFHRATTPP